MYETTSDMSVSVNDSPSAAGTTSAFSDTKADKYNVTEWKISF